MAGVEPIGNIDDVVVEIQNEDGSWKIILDSKNGILPDPIPADALDPQKDWPLGIGWTIKKPILTGWPGRSSDTTLQEENMEEIKR